VALAACRRAGRVACGTAAAASARVGTVRDTGTVLVRKLAGHVVNEGCHGGLVEAVSLGHHTLAEAVGDMVGGDEGGDHRNNVDGNDGEDKNVPVLKGVELELQIRALAAREGCTRVASRRDGGTRERREVAAALEHVLDAETALDAELL